MVIAKDKKSNRKIIQRYINQNETEGAETEKIKKDTREKELMGLKSHKETKTEGL
jgi:hypothetical protein